MAKKLIQSILNNKYIYSPLTNETCNIMENRLYSFINENNLHVEPIHKISKSYSSLIGEANYIKTIIYKEIDKINRLINFQQVDFYYNKYNKEVGLFYHGNCPILDLFNIQDLLDNYKNRTEIENDAIRMINF